MIDSHSQWIIAFHLRCQTTWYLNCFSPRISNMCSSQPRCRNSEGSMLPSCILKRLLLLAGMNSIALCHGGVPAPDVGSLRCCEDSYQKMLKATCWNLEAAAQIRCMDFFASPNDWITAMQPVDQQDQRRRSAQADISVGVSIAILTLECSQKKRSMFGRQFQQQLTTADFQSISKISQKIQSQACRIRQ